MHGDEALKTHFIKDKTINIVYTKRQVILFVKAFAKIFLKKHKSIVFLLSNITQHYSIQGQC